MSAEEREEISRGLAASLGVAAIAAGLGRDRSVIIRELARNGGREKYRAGQAQECAEALACRPKERKLERDRRLHDAVAAGLANDWSPEQIANRLAAAYPDDEAMRVSHETIYECLYLQARGELRTEVKLGPPWPPAAQL